MVGSCLLLTPCRLSAIAYSMNSQLLSISGGHLLHPQPDDAPCRGERNRKFWFSEKYATQKKYLTIDLSEDELGRPLKGLLDGYNREAETGHLLAQLRDHNTLNIHSTLCTFSQPLSFYSTKSSHFRSDIFINTSLTVKSQEPEHNCILFMNFSNQSQYCEQIIIQTVISGRRKYFLCAGKS
jgi:hypothetical protein